MAVPRNNAPRFGVRLVDVFLLRDAEQRASRYTPEQNERLVLLHQAGTERLRAARDLRDATRIGAAGALYREALLLVPRALLFSWDPLRPTDDLDVTSAWQELESRLLLPEPQPAFSDGKGRRVQAFREAQALATEQDPLVLDRTRPVDALRRLDAAHETLTRLLSQIEPRSVRAIRRFRIVRISLTGLIVLGVVVAFVSWIIAPKNVALNKPIQASNYFPGSASADRLVNGEFESPWASAVRAPDSWFAIDLLSEHAIERVVVYNRTDPHGRDTTPFIVELSADGKAYREVARFTGRASPAQRWVFEPRGQTARHVRVKKVDARGLAITEIEVYGSKR